MVLEERNRAEQEETNLANRINNLENGSPFVEKSLKNNDGVFSVIDYNRAEWQPNFIVPFGTDLSEIAAEDKNLLLIPSADITCLQIIAKYYGKSYSNHKFFSQFFYTDLKLALLDLAKKFRQNKGSRLRVKYKQIITDSYFRNERRLAVCSFGITDLA